MNFFFIYQFISYLIRSFIQFQDVIKMNKCKTHLNGEGLFPENDDEWEAQVERFRKQNRMGKSFPEDQGLFTFLKMAIFSSKPLDTYKEYGPNTVILFGLLIRIIIMLMICMCVYMLPSIYLNQSGNYCQVSKVCSMNNTLYFWSVMNILGNEESNAIQLGLWIAISVIILFFNLHMRIFERKKYNQINNINLTDADFSLIFRRLPEPVTNEAIKKLVNDLEFYQEGIEPQIDRIFFIYSLKESNEGLNQIIDRRKDQIKKYLRENECSQIPRSLSKLSMKELSNVRVPHKFAKSAIVRFKTTKVSENVKRKTRLVEKLIHYFFPFYHKKMQYKVFNEVKLQEKRIFVERAPEPNEIIWKNFGYSEKQKIIRKLIFTAVILLLLCASAGVLFGIGKWVQAEKKKNKQQPIWLIIVSVAITFIFNKSFIRFAIFIAVKKNYFTSKTEEDIDLMHTMVINESLNLGIFSILVPFLVKLPDIIGGAQAASLPFNMFLTIIVAAFTLPLLRFLFTYFEVFTRATRWFIRRKYIILTQMESNIRLKTPMIPFVNIYVDLTQVIWFGFLFATVTPISLIIASAGIILLFICEKILFYKKYSIPQYGSSRINSEFIDSLDAIPLQVSLMNYLIYGMFSQHQQKPLSSRIQFLLFFNLAIGSLIFALPWSNLLSKFQSFRIKSKTSENFSKEGVYNKYEEYDPNCSARNKKLSIYPSLFEMVSAQMSEQTTVDTQNDAPESEEQFSNPTNRKILQKE